MPANNMSEKLTIVDYSKNIGKQGLLTITLAKIYKIKVLVDIKNVEILYGHPCYTVQPVGGEGQARVREGLEILQSNATI